MQKHQNDQDEAREETADALLNRWMEETGQQVDVKELVIRMCQQSEQEGQKLFNQLPTSSVLFVPASRLNWEPIRRYADLAEVFVYADWTIQNADCREATRQIESASLLFSAAADRFLSAAVMADLPWGLDQMATPWIEIAEIERPGGGFQKPLWLIYIGGNPAIAYRIVFNERGFAPKFIFRPSRPEQVPPDAWSAFFGPQGPFMAAVNANLHRPKALISDLQADVW